MAKRAKQRLLIDLRCPMSGQRITIKGDELTVAPENLAAWVPVVERLKEIACAHFGRESARHPEAQRDGEGSDAAKI